ncbi:choice-of-anchor D domain-containing protein, partial [bacterium]
LYSLPQQGIVFRERFIGAQEADVVGKDPARTHVNWYKGSDPSRWREGLPTYGSVHLGTLYESIDIQLSAKDGNMEKLFLIKPGGRVADIRVQVQGVLSITTDSTGELVVKGPHGQVHFTRPVAYQGDGREKRMVKVAYRVEGEEYGFTVGEYDRSIPLVIDPLLASTYLGGSRNETAYAVGDSGRDIIVAGMVESPDFPGLDEQVNALGDAFVALLDRDLTTVRTATYLGGSMSDGVRDIALDRRSIYAAGFNTSIDFPTTPGAAFDERAVSGAFVARLNLNTLHLQASTSFYSNVFAVAAAPDGAIFIGGSTTDSTFPTSGKNTHDEGDEVYQETLQGGADGFVAKLNRDLSTLEASTFLGGEGVDIISDLAVDGAGNPVAIGITNSAGFPVSENAFDNTYNLEWDGKHQWIDGFVTRLTSDLKDLDASTYLGGGLNDYIRSVTLDGSSVIVGGDTASVDFPCGTTFGPVDGSDAFVVRLEHNLNKVSSCALYGGGATGRGSVDTVTDIEIHPRGSIFIVGRTDTQDFPTTPGAFFTRPEGTYTGGYITAFAHDLSYVEASTLIHGANEYIKSLAIDNMGNVIVAGDAHNKGYPVMPGTLQPSPAGGDDVIVSRFTPDLTGPHLEAGPAVTDFGDIPIGLVESEIVILHNSGGSPLTVHDMSITQPSNIFSLDSQCHVIAPFDSCPVTVTFSPRDPGSRTAGVTITSDDPFRPVQTVDLTGTGKAVPVITVEPDSLHFPNVNPGRTSRIKTVVVNNSGSSDLSITGVHLAGQDRDTFALASEECTRSPLATDGKCLISVQFSPKDEGMWSAKMEIFSNDPADPIHRVSLSGNGTNALDITDGRSNRDESGSSQDTDTDSDRFPWLIVIVLCVVMGLLVIAALRTKN